MGNGRKGSAQPDAPPVNGAERVSVMASKKVSKASKTVFKTASKASAPAPVEVQTAVKTAVRLLSAPVPVTVPFIPQPRTNLLPLGAQIAPEGAAIKVICHSIGRNFRGRHPVTFCTESGCTAFSVWLGFSQIKTMRISAGAFYAFNGTVESHPEKDYGRGFLPNNMTLYTIERLD